MVRPCFGSKGSASQHESGNRQSGLHRGFSFLITSIGGDDRTVWQHEVFQTSARTGRPGRTAGVYRKEYTPRSNRAVFETSADLSASSDADTA
jgi:hypothetical protein